ncbi:hypothetical protein KFE25_003516 [Diacronema lutheri]|uniref:tRNA-dihydrouridine(16/17) synthase [NAD(P)(+)] n=1 Tax=Diacronema lutheri TaxID=2081491 RepID=A0A8J6CED3_DIALT|nr:hypothetical protein KFE25_003516 [Diacronema lutheri]
MLTGRSWWASLGSPRCVAAPMVAQSELAFRLLARRYGAELCYTPMLLAKLYAAVPEYRADHFSTCAADRPLVAQLAGHDPDTMVRAALLLQPHVDAIDINLGCPQGIARKGKYGAYLLPDVERVCQIVRALCAAIDLPITCKVRLLPSLGATVDACRRFEDAGVSALTVHGRTREQNKQFVGSADWTAIATVTRALTVPVIANGGIATAADVDACLRETGAAAVMSSEALLGNPALFAANRDPATGAHVTQRRLAREYLQLAREVGAPDASARAHVFKLLHGALCARPQLRDRLAEAYGLDQFEGILDALDELDPTLLLEPMAHTAEGERAERRVLQWYLRHQCRDEARALLADGRPPAGGEGERTARRVRRAQHKAVLRERHAARVVKLANAAASDGQSRVRDGAAA